MNIAFWLREDQCSRNNIFYNSKDATGSKAHLKYKHLFEFLRDKKIKLTTYDVVDNYETLDAAIFVDYPLIPSKKALEIFNLKIPKILITDENKHTRPDVWDKINLNKFDYVFCCDDTYIDNLKFFKHHAHDHYKDLNLNYQILKKEFENKKFSSMISWNKKSKNSSINYQKRINIIDWFEKHYSKDFDLYGPNWDEFVFPWDVPILRRLNTNRFTKFRKVLGKNYSNWKGSVVEKVKCINDYKFIFVFENTEKINGYITEKIFDVFYGGSIPIYFGAENIEDYIDSKCFIDLRKFKSLEDLYSYLKMIDKNTYQIMLTEVEKFLSSKNSYSFTTKYFCEKIYSTLLKI